ncbi:MAG: bifunctional phosphoribosylaminoimidazolecarboxamide formyltransferase/IMP cyclohydrolase [Wenzhouxiangellaceae bacterium]
MSDSSSAAPTIRRALLSVSDKQGLIPLAQALNDAGVEILSTGGSARHLREHGLAVTAVEQVTGFPEIMDGRVKTLHPAIHGGILARRDSDADVMQEHGIQGIDLVVVNLYPFAATIAQADCSPDQAIEQIDIGGPAMIRAAAKNHAWVTVLVDPADYDDMIASLPTGVDHHSRRRWAAKAFAHTAAYDQMISNYLRQQAGDDNADDASLPERLTLSLRQRQPLRYGENPHQRAALYTDESLADHGLAAAQPLQGKALSYNNLLDADAAWSLVRQWRDEAACVIVKHGNPCGAAVAADLLQAYEQALACDPQSAFGGIIACNQPVDERVAQQILKRQFAEVIIAPRFTPGALGVCAAKPNLRLLPINSDQQAATESLELRCIDGGILVQDRDRQTSPRSDWQVVSQRQPSADEWRDLSFAWRVVGSVKSNAIVYAANGATLGIGAGQMSRVDSARIAADKARSAELNLRGAAMASDAFLPFPDSVEAAAEAGISIIVQPGGSIRDEAVIAAADAHDVAMVFTGRRHFRH